MMKKAIKILALILAASLLAACGSQPAAPADSPAEVPADSSAEVPADSSAEVPADNQYVAADGKVKMALIVGASGGTFYGPIQQKFEEQCTAYGWEYTFMAPAGGEGLEAEIITLCDTALVQGYNVIATIMNDKDMFEDFLNRAEEQGVLVLAFNTNPGEDVVPAMVGIDNYASGYQQGEKIAEYATSYGWDEIRYISACTALNRVGQQEAKRGVLAALADKFNGNVIELGETESNGSASTAQDQIGATYIAHPDVNTIFCIEAFSAVGAGAFIEENDLEGKVIACGLALDKDAFLRVQNGSWTATSSVDVEWMGMRIAEVAHDILEGKEVPYNNFPDKIWVTNQEEIDAYCASHDISMD